MLKISVPDIRPLLGWVKTNRKRLLLFGGSGLFVLVLILQFVYPTDRLLPLANIDGQDLGWHTKQEAAQILNDLYDKHKLAIYMGDDAKPVVTTDLKQIGIKVDNVERVSSQDYAWYWRLVPSSILWAHNIGVRDIPKPSFGDKFDEYVEKRLMGECRREPTNATIKADGDKLEVVPAKEGASCELGSVVATLKSVRPNLTVEDKLRVAQEHIAPAIDDVQAEALRTKLTDRLGGGVYLRVGNETITVGAADIYSWLDFALQEDALTTSVSQDRAGKWLNEQVAVKVAVQPGTSYIKTLDFTEISRRDGSSGAALDIAETVAELQRVVDGTSAQATARTMVVPPTEQYERTYSSSDTGLSALMADYANDHKGTYGVSMVELDGRKRRASYQVDKQFVTASTYKLLVAYSLLKQIDAGKRSWASAETCFNKMISLSDNPCAEQFLDNVGVSNVTKDIQAVGLANSTFMKRDGPFTTANDLVLLLGMLQSQQNFSSVNRDRLINALKANVYRRGIPAGVSGTVADKVGFLDGLLHDAAIVYSPSGTYVLAILTDGSSWANIAELAGQIDRLRAQ